MIEKSKMSKFLELISLCISFILILSYNISFLSVVLLNDIIILLLILFSVFSWNFIPFDLFLIEDSVLTLGDELSIVRDACSIIFELFKSIELIKLTFDSFLFFFKFDFFTLLALFLSLGDILSSFLKCTVFIFGSLFLSKFIKTSKNLNIYNIFMNL